MNNRLFADYTHCKYYVTNVFYDRGNKNHWFPYQHKIGEKSFNFEFCNTRFEIVPNMEKYVETFHAIWYETKKCLLDKCPFVNSINHIALNIKKDVRSRLKGSDLLPYYFLFELIKSFPTGEYDSILTGIAKYVGDLDGWSDESLELEKHYMKRIINRINKANVMVCKQRTSCAYKVLVKDIKNLKQW